MELLKGVRRETGLLAHLSDVADSLATHQKPRDIRHRLTQGHRGHNVTDGLGLSLIPEHVIQSKLRVFELLDRGCLLNVEETHVKSIPHNHCGSASIPNCSPVDRANLTQETP